MNAHGLARARYKELFALEALSEGAASTGTRGVVRTPNGGVVPPGLTPGFGALIAVIDFTPSGSGLVQVQYTLSGADAAADNIQSSIRYFPALTAITGGTLVAPGLTVEPSSVTAGAPVDLTVDGLISAGATSFFLGGSVLAQAVPGQRTGFAVFVSAAHALSAMNLSFSAQQQ